LGCFFLGISFLGLMYATIGIEATTRINFMWLVGCTFVYTLGELYLSPIGLSLVTKVAPARLVGMLMGAWYLSSFFGNYLAGYLGTYYEKMPLEKFFLMLTILGCLAGAAIFALQKPLKNAVGHNV
jgi:POT family proton-dependent oligopeptide transporter